MIVDNTDNRMLRIVITGVGGQGVLSASKLLGQAAGTAGFDVQSSAIHGMAQRGGVVETYVIIGERYSPMIDSGEADVIVGFEPVETLRALPRGNNETFVISNDQSVIPFICSFTGAEYPETGEVLQYVKEHVRNLVVVNAAELAQKAGSILAMNMVMLGVLAGTGILPFDIDYLENTIEDNTSSRFKMVNLDAYSKGLEEGRKYK